MTPETRKLLARRHMGLAISEDMVEWAVSLLEAGIDSKNVRILAGLMKPLYAPEVEDYFRRSFNDLGWSFPEPEECLCQYIYDVAEAITSGAMPPMEGCREIYQVYCALDYSSDLRRWDFLDGGLDPDTYNDLTGAELEAAITHEAKTLLDTIANQKT